MLGIVLWHDQKSNKALIMCEDYGDLAYFEGKKEFDGGALTELGRGDLVRFDVNEDRNHRLAVNPKSVCRGIYAWLPEALQEAVGMEETSIQSLTAGPALRITARSEGVVVPFPMQHARPSGCF